MENNIFISFYLYSSAIHLHRKALKSINNPSFVEFLVNHDRKTFAVRSCDKKSMRSFRVNENNQRNKVEFYSLSLCRYLAKMNLWDEGGSYRISGKAHPMQGLMIFDFADVEKIKDVDAAQ